MTAFEDAASEDDARSGESASAADEVSTAADNASTATESSPDAGDPAEAFAALSDPLRVDILRELTAHRRETGEATVGFAALRRRVGVRDSGRFRYHLNELRDRFVEKTDDGYRLTTAGVEVVGAVLAGTYAERPTMGPVELDSTCSACETAAVASYEDGLCVVTCENDHPLFQWRLPPNATTDVDLPTAVERAELLATQAIDRALRGICPSCYDPVEPEVTPTDGAGQPRFGAVCDTCGVRVLGPVTFCLLVDPTVPAFYQRHGRSLRDQHMWEPAFVADEDATTVTETDPLRAEVAVTLDDETLAVTVDESGHVVAVDGPK